MTESKEKDVDSIRISVTKEKIKDKFVEIYINKPINKITIKEITESLQLNRGTFYLHFIDIYDLLEQIEDEFLESILNFINGALVSEENLQDKFINTNRGFIQVLRYLKRRKSYTEALFKENSSFIMKLRSNIKKIFLNYLQLAGFVDRGINQLNIEYILFGNLGIVIYWIENNMEIDERELVDKLSEFVFNGPLGLIGKESIKNAIGNNTL